MKDELRELYQEFCYELTYDQSQYKTSMESFWRWLVTGRPEELINTMTPEESKQFDELPQTGMTTKEFINQLISRRTERLLAVIEGMRKDEHPMEDGVPVETYGYEAEYNSALSDLAELIKKGV